MISLKMMVIAGALASAGGMAQAAPLKVPGEGAAQWQGEPAQVCSAMSVSKHFTLADADFAWARERLNARLDHVAPAARGLSKAVGHRIAADATQFGIRLDHARCDALAGPLDGERIRSESGGWAKDCRDAGCEDPLPGWTTPDGSTMALWTCEGKVFREVVYERVNGTWRVKSVREELVSSCQVSKEPGDDREPRDGKQ